MNIVVNGEQRVIEEETTVEELLKTLKIEDKTMAAAINMQVVKKDLWSTTVIEDGAKVEFLHFVGGG
ncbi:MAG TPA: sulfur carrier protein ThiS [Campylobacterales bacterium]|nr:sulfur carrier protein ThiS [Campylobacterales bacterium]